MTIVSKKLPSCYQTFCYCYKFGSSFCQTSFPLFFCARDALRRFWRCPRSASSSANSRNPSVFRRLTTIICNPISNSCLNKLLQTLILSMRYLFVECNDNFLFGSWVSAQSAKIPLSIFCQILEEPYRYLATSKGKQVSESFSFTILWLAELHMSLWFDFSTRSFFWTFLLSSGSLALDRGIPVMASDRPADSWRNSRYYSATPYGIASVCFHASLIACSQ